MVSIDSVQNLIDKAARLADGQPITQIRATVGDLAGMAPAEVQAAFERCRLGTPAENANLHLEREPGRVVCLTCDQERQTPFEGEACPACGSLRGRVIGGHLLELNGVSVARGTPGAGRRAGRAARNQPALAGAEGSRQDGW